MASIAMMFAGLTSGYIVRQAQGNWRYFQMPVVFWISTGLILLSSVTIFMALRAFKARRMPQYRMLVGLTLALGIAFGVCQFIGFKELYAVSQPVVMSGSGTEAVRALQSNMNPRPVRVDGNPSESFLFIIAGLHLVHIAGGIIALAIVVLRSWSRRKKIYSATGLEIAAQYWHFVDLLWIYLFVFLLANQ
ncbi:MAG: heme-copper oxidase subunit III [Sphingobacteriales bacterium]|nr:MAG: heme-copper oxidase subunit III [Sphingobacteriales bacterium]